MKLLLWGEQMNEKRVINNVYIVAGGEIGDEIAQIKPTAADIVIAVDSGAERLFDRDIVADYFLGDFDSLNGEYLATIERKYAERMICFPTIKNETDSELAMQFAIGFAPKNIFFYGATGTRIDHILANINILLQAEKRGINAVICDQFNRIQLLLAERTLTVKRSDYQYLSLIAFSERVEFQAGSGLKYPLENLVLTQGLSRGLSNEIIADEATITISSGVLLVIESRD